MLFVGTIRQDSAHTRARTLVLLAAAISLVFFVILLYAPDSNAATEVVTDQADTAATNPPGRLVNSPLLRLPDYSKHSDHQLTELGVRWDTLGPQEQQALLREVKLRMAQRKGSDGVLTIRTQRRYGGIGPTGERYMKIETRVVRVRPSEPDRSPERQSFGVGFEQRTASTEPDSESDSQVADATPEASAADVVVQAGATPDRQPESPPVVRVSDPSL